MLFYMINGYIYKIECNITQEVYIGSTTNFSKRKSYHNNYKNYIKYTTKKCKATQIIDREDYTIDIIEKCSVNNLQELHIIEQIYIDMIKDLDDTCVNLLRSYRTPEQLYQQKQKANKRYYEKHKIKILTAQREYRKKMKLSS